MAGKNIKALALSAAAITVMWCQGPAFAGLIDPNDPALTPFVVTQGDFSTISTDYASTFTGENLTVKFTDVPVFVYTGQNGKTNPSGIEDPYAAQTGNNTSNYYFQMGSSFDGAGCTPSCTTFADPGPDPAAGTTHTWDTSITALNTALGGQSMVFYFWMNETGNADTLSGLDLMAWGSVTLHDSTGALPDKTYFLTNDKTASQTSGGPDPSLGTCDVNAATPYSGNAGCATTNQNGTPEATNADPRWTYVSGFFCVNKTTGVLLHFGSCTAAEKSAGNEDIQNNLGVNQAAFGAWNPELDEIVANNGCVAGGCYDTLQGDFRLSMIDNGFEVLAIAGNGTSPPPPGIPEPSSLAILGAALMGLGVWRKHRRAAV